MRPFSCGHCGTTVFFENIRCDTCGATLGFVPDEGRMAAFPPDAPGRIDGPDIRSDDGGRPLRACLNRSLHEACNWMVAADDPQPRCRSCRLTEMIPDLSLHLNAWRAFEQAKRRLVFTLIGIGLAPEPKAGPDDPRGLSFRLLASLPGEPPVLTGHDNGVITLNLAETDDVLRETARVSMHESVRTVLGHLRHEVSHYLQQRHIDGTPAIDDCRAVFGDERADYAAALATHYARGPADDWPQHFVSAYAGAHPWEDWAETCAHYLLMLDAVQTASAWGLSLDGPADAQPGGDRTDTTTPARHLALNQWLPIAQFLNAMNRSLGERDSYPFLMPDAVLAKLDCVQQLLARAAATLKAPAATA